MTKMHFARRFLGSLLEAKFLCRAGGCLAIIYLAAVAFLCAFEDRFVFHPVAASRKWIELPNDIHFEDVELKAAGNRLHARWYPCAHRRAVVFCHSRAGNLTLELDAANIERWANELECSVLIFDYPGYGRSEGRPSEEGFYAAADAAYDWLAAKGVPAMQTLIYGRSLGSAVAVELASRRQHLSLILVSPMTSLPDAAFRQIPFVPTNWLMRNRFDSLSRLDRCVQPTFVVHGDRDHVVPFEQGQRIAAALPGRKRFHRVVGASHGDCVTPEFYKDLKEFLNDIDRDREPGASP
jgi:pimeloyl-ACP methyl ester carboxylesterase